MVATLDVPTLKNVKVALETLDMLNVTPGHRHLLLNRADDAVGIGTEKVEAILSMPITAQVSTSIDIAAATNAGKPIALSAPDHASSRAIRSLANTLIGEDLSEADERTDDNNSRRRRKRR
jgi:pilus assembly protein CpaE